MEELNWTMSNLRKESKFLLFILYLLLHFYAHYKVTLGGFQVILLQAIVSHESVGGVFGVVFLFFCPWA